MKPTDVVNGIKAATKLAVLERHYMYGYNDVKSGRQVRARDKNVTDEQWLAYIAGRQDAHAGRRARGGAR